MKHRKIDMVHKLRGTKPTTSDFIRDIGIGQTPRNDKYTTFMVDPYKIFVFANGWDGPHMKTGDKAYIATMIHTPRNTPYKWRISEIYLCGSPYSSAYPSAAKLHFKNGTYLLTLRVDVGPLMPL